MSKFFNSFNQHNKELSLVCCKHPLLSLRGSHFSFIFKHHIPSTLSPSLSLEGLVIISTSGLEFQIVLCASSCHILLARAQFLLVQDNVRGGLTWTLACVASVSSRGSSTKLGQEQKKNMNDRGGGGERRNRLPANPTILKNCVRPRTQLLIGAVRVVLIT